MITRIWHGRTSPASADQYLRFLINEGTEDYRNTKGNLSVKVLKDKKPDGCHFLTITEWKDIPSIQSFAGEDYEKAVYYPADNGVLLEMEEKVQHYETYDVSSSRINDLIRQLKELDEGGSWQGESFSEKLNDMSAEQVFTQPVKGIHSIAEIIWHSIYWRTTLIKRMEGEHNYRDNTVEKYNFLPLSQLQKKGWEVLWSEWKATQENILTKLLNKRDDFLKEYSSGKTYEYFIEGIIQHDIYHLGQIGLVKKMIAAGR